MRVTALSAVCAAALVLPVSAAPLAETVTMTIPVVQATVTLSFNAPSEVPNLPNSPKTNTAQAHRLSKFKVARMPRAADFREADYGINRNATFAPVPVEGVEATPTAAAISPASTVFRRSEEDWEAARLDPDHTYSSAADSAADSASGAAEPSVSAPPAFPLAIGDLKDTNPNHIPVHPDMSVVSNIAGKGVQTAGESRLKAAYGVHDGASAIFAPLQPAMAKSNPAQLDKAGAPLSHGLLRRMLRPSSYIAAPLRRAFTLAKAFSGHGQSHGLGEHAVNLDMNPLIPSRPDSTLNMSDPYVAQEEMRKEHAGVINIDSNRPAPPPPHAPDVPLNATNAANSTATTALKDGEGDAKNATALPVDDASKTPVDSAARMPVDKTTQKAAKTA